MYFKSGDAAGGDVHVSADARDGTHFLIFARVDLENGGLSLSTFIKPF